MTISEAGGEGHSNY